MVHQFPGNKRAEAYDLSGLEKDISELLQYLRGNKSKAPKKEPGHGPILQRIYSRYKLGLVGALLLLDFFVFAVFLGDLWRFVLRGGRVEAAARVASEVLGQDEVVSSIVSALVFFVIAVPFIASLLPGYLTTGAVAREDDNKGRGGTDGQPKHTDVAQSQQPPSMPKWKGLLFARGRPIVLSHLGFSVLIIPLLTVLGYTMQVLCGFRNTNAAHSFVSYWMVAVGKINWMSSVIFLPTLLKLVVRFLGRDGSHVVETTKEGLTEWNLELKR